MHFPPLSSNPISVSPRSSLPMWQDSTKKGLGLFTHIVLKYRENRVSLDWEQNVL